MNVKVSICNTNIAYVKEVQNSLNNQHGCVVLPLAEVSKVLKQTSRIMLTRSEAHSNGRSTSSQNIFGKAILNVPLIWEITT